MTHFPESEFAAYVGEWLRANFDSVEQNVYLPSTGRYVDFLAEGPLCTWAIEVENDADSVIEAVGQATLYAAHERDYCPLYHRS